MFMKLETLLNREKWDWVGPILGMKGSKFERLIMRFIEMEVPKCHEVFVETHADEFYMTRMNRDGYVINNYPYVQYTMDITFKMAFRPCGSTGR